MSSCLTFDYATCGSTCADTAPVNYHVFIDNGNTVESCGTGQNEHVILSAIEYVKLQNNSAENFLNAIIDPSFVTTEQYQMLFMLGLTTPLFGYLVAWGYQTVISFMTKN